MNTQNKKVKKKREVRLKSKYLILHTCDLFSLKVYLLRLIFLEYRVTIFFKYPNITIGYEVVDLN